MIEKDEFDTDCIGCPCHCNWMVWYILLITGFNIFYFMQKLYLGN